MNYCIVDENGIITNIIVCDDDATAEKMCAVKGYAMARIGELYDPYNYHALTEANSRISELELLINNLISASSSKTDK